MSNAIQDSILKSIDTLVNNRIDKIQADKTITAQIVSCTNALKGEYRLSYQGGFITAYAQEEQSYRQNTSVYVLVPMGDFTNRKHIIGKAQAVQEDNNISFVASAMGNYNLIGSNVIKPYKTPPNGYWSFTSYIKDNYVALYDRDISPEEAKKNGMCYIDGDALSNYIKDAEALMIEATFKTNLPREHRITKTGQYGVSFVLAFADKDAGRDAQGNPLAINNYSYVLDTNNMTGNPFQYQRWNDQYMIFPIDTENFLYVQSILFFGNDFVDKDDTVNATLNPENVWVKELEIYGLKEISAVNGDYKLALSTPAGATLHSTRSEEEVSAVAKLTKLESNLSDAAMFYWFKEDSRITPSSADYQMYGGPGWRRLKDKGCSYKMTTNGYENRAYENKYLCVAVYQETMVLKTYFTIYNDSCKWDISITSSLGERFSFDRGVPELTCLIDGKSENFDSKPTGDPLHKGDNLFSFYWSKEDETGQVFTFSQTEAEIDAEIDRILKDDTITQKAGLLLSLREKKAQLSGAVFQMGKNKLSYPVKNFQGNAKFSCSVYSKDNAASEDWYGIGSAEILLQNADAATPTDYYIVIEGGDQVFQYSESGVAPDSERYSEDERLKIKPLTIHFYDPAGLEVNPNTYTWKFIVPTDDTMIEPPLTLTKNPVNDKIEVYVGDTYPVAIKQSYDFQALNNQVKAVVNYGDQEYSQLTTFLFAKVGENGTNGTDLVAKIDPISPPKDCLLAMVLNNGTMRGFNNGKAPGEKVLEYKLFARNEPLTLEQSRVFWNVNGYNGDRSRFLNTAENSQSGTTASVYFRSGSWGSSPQKNVYAFQQLVMQANTVYDQNAAYANYGMPLINYVSSGYEIKLDKDYTLRNVLYNADGRSPLYNKNQGVFLKVLYNGKDVSDTVAITYIAQGGDVGESPYIGLSYEKNPPAKDIHTTLPSRHTIKVDKTDADGQIILDQNGNAVKEEKIVNTTQIYITPADTFNGAYTNNNVRVEVRDGGILRAVAIVPIYMSLNTYGLKSLNAWDGNTLQINEEENYLLAPQIGAGEKDNRNRFTGVVMGVSEYYDQADNKTSKQNGLLGYSHGEQSIFLDAETGKAVFGLPEDNGFADSGGDSKRYTEGRIELVPRGTSKIGEWKIASRSLYNVLNAENNANGGMVKPDATYGTFHRQNTALVIPHDKGGVLINAEPSFLSIKTPPIISGINFGDVNTVITPKDALEIELNPNTHSAFTIYRHPFNSVSNTYGTRTPLVGINNNGQFYTNAIENGESTMGIGAIGAFGITAAGAADADGVVRPKYAGAQFAFKNNNVFKFFVPFSGGIDEKLYLSAGTNTSNEYARPVGIYGKNISLFSSTTNSTSENSDYRFVLGGARSEALEMGCLASSNPNYFRMQFGTDDAAQTHLEMANRFVVNQNTSRTALLTLGNTIITTNTLTENTTGANGRTATVSTGNYTINVPSTNRSFTAQAGSNSGESSYRSQVNLTNTQALIGTNDIGNTKGSRLTLGRGTGGSALITSAKFTTTALTGGIEFMSSDATTGFVATARRNSSSTGQSQLQLLPAADGNSTFHLSSGCGQIFSTVGTVNGVSGTRYLSSSGTAPTWLYVSGKVPSSNGSDFSIVANRGIYAAETIQGRTFRWRSNFTYRGSNFSIRDGNTSIWETCTSICNGINSNKGTLNSHTNTLNSHSNTLNNHGSRISSLENAGYITGSALNGYIKRAAVISIINSLINDINARFQGIRIAGALLQQNHPTTAGNYLFDIGNIATRS